MLTVPEAAERLKRNPETIRRWIRDGKLRSTRVGTQYVLDEADVDELGAEAEVLGEIPATATGEPMPNFVAAVRSSRTR